ncbi:alanine--tRNA ligase-related protein [Halorarius halobius]|uniref:alanine--tRNA ligase-related protein n=1 Tax=Halorarius halobius TaxID=2962671 RepID=UPI0020CFE630|nr:DHHA1 domain-containing protein [Halorarius halobius]
MSRAPEDPYTLTFDAEVVEGGREAVLSETYFYPEGGGQPPDRGTVGGVAVEDVQTRDGEVVHTLADPVEAGETVTCNVDPEFRTYCMRAHTASHALYGAGRRVLDELGYGGFDIDDRKVRVDFTTTTDIDDDTLAELERLVNRAVWDSRPVSWETRPKAEALGDEDVAFNTKTEEGIAGDTVRVVTIDGWDAAACGGTHVRNTREIGPVTVLGRSNPGEGLTRVEFAVGPAAIERRTTEKRALADAAAELGVAPDDVPGRLAELQADLDDLRAERDALQAELAAARVGELPVVERDGATWLVGELDMDANDLGELAREQAGDRADVVAFVAPGGTLAVATDGSVDADDVVESVTDAFGGGGGGSPTVAQAGGLDASADEVVAFLRSE